MEKNDKRRRKDIQEDSGDGIPIPELNPGLSSNKFQDSVHQPGKDRSNEVYKIICNLREGREEQ
jgi:hypothetical protein